jgi:hypothetical protein
MPGLPNIKNYMWKPATEQFSTLNWTNNSCESMNNILKLSANWKALKLPKMLEKLHQIVKLQYKDMRRNLHGQRNYTLASWTKKFQVSTVVWESKTEEKKEQAANSIACRSKSHSFSADFNPLLPKMSFITAWTLKSLAPMSCLSLRLTFSSRWCVHNMCLESGKQWCSAFVIAFSSSEPKASCLPLISVPLMSWRWLCMWLKKLWYVW